MKRPELSRRIAALRKIHETTTEKNDSYIKAPKSVRFLTVRQDVAK